MLRTLLRPTAPAALLRLSARLASSQGHAFERIPLEKRGGDVGEDDFRDKAVLVYFSAGWCPSCRELTPLLKQFYENTKDAGLQVVWVSRDRSAEDQEEYYNDNLPAWPYIPHGNKEINDFLQIYNIQTIPAVKLVRSDGVVVDDKARNKIEKNHSDADKCKKIVEEWQKQLKSPN